MSQLPISNIINVSIATVQTGINEYNTSNVALFSDEIPADSFGDLGYAIYLSPVQVATDFGTNSKTYAMANAVFSQQPNILNGGGSLIVILLGIATEQFAFSGVAASGTFVANWNGNASAAINYNDTAVQIQGKLQAIPGLSAITVTGSIASQTLTISMQGVYGAAPAAFTITSNSLMTSAPADVTITVSTPTAGESIGAAITRTANTVQYFGIMVTETVDGVGIGGTDLAAAAAIVQPLNKIALWVGYEVADIESPSGILYALKTGSFNQSRGLYYGDDSAVNGYVGWNALIMMASYAGVGFSTNFSGSNTTQTMNLKTLIGVSPDPTMTQTIYTEAVAAGVDIYPSLQGVPAVISTGANTYFDQIYGTLWFSGALQVAGFNYLATTNTKIPQTESGMDGLKSAYRAVCQQAVTNQLSAPGVWNSSVTFGNQQQLVLNVGQYGYYIYSVPIAQQLQAARVARQAPLVSIAMKLAGAIQESTVIVYINQ
jgi:hypothetical protein